LSDFQKAIIALKPEGRKAVDIENSINEWLQSVPKNLFKSITFDCGKEFSSGKVLVIRMILIFISQTQERLPNGD
jgi:IS30 family transposase